MFPKTLLAIVTSDQDLDALHEAIALSDAHGCHLAVTVIGIALPPPTMNYGVFPLDTWSEEREAGRSITADKVDQAREILAAKSISADVISYFCDESQIADAVATRANYADLALVYDDAGMDERIKAKVLSGLTFESAKPFLIISNTSKQTLKPKRVLIAWNGSSEAARAVHLALDFLSTAESVHVVMVDPITREFEQGEEPGSDIASYLARHGAKVSVDVLSGGGREPAEVLHRHATDIAADMIVAGAYGHSRLREYIFGGTTRSLLESVDTPLFMAH